MPQPVTMPLWVARCLQHALRGVSLRDGHVVQTSPAERWRIVLQLGDDTEVVTGVEPADQTPERLERVIREAVMDAGRPHRRRA